MTVWLCGLTCPQSGEVRVLTDDVVLACTAHGAALYWDCAWCGAVHDHDATPAWVRVLTAPGSGVIVVYDITEMADPQRHTTRSATPRTWVERHARLLDPTNPRHRDWWCRELATIGASEGVRGW